MDFRTVEVPKQCCPNCKAELDRASGMSDSGPKPGDMSICLACGSFLMFEDEMKVRLVTDEEVAALPDDERIDLIRGRKNAEEIRRAQPRDRTRAFLAKSADEAQQKLLASIGLREIPEPAALLLRGAILYSMAPPVHRIGQNEQAAELLTLLVSAQKTSGEKFVSLMMDLLTHYDLVERAEPRKLVA